MGRLLGFGAFLALGICVPALADEPPRAAAQLDAESSLVYLEITHPGALIDRAASERVRSLLRAVPGYEKAFDTEQYRQGRQVVEILAQALETTPEKGLRQLAGGNIVLAVEGEKGADRVFLIVTPTDPAFLDKAHAKLLELARQDAQGKGKPDPVSEKEHNGVKAFSVAPTEAHAIIDGRLVIANGGDQLAVFIDRVKGEPLASSLAKDQLWLQRRERASADSSAWAFARLARLRKVDPKRFGPEKADTGALFLFGPWIESVRTADWVAASLTWTDDRLAAEIDLPLPPIGHPKSLSGFFPAKGQGASTTLRPPGTIASLSLWRDLSAVWEARGEIFEPEAQQGFAQLDTFAGQFFGGRDFASGVLGALSTNWRLVVARQNAATLKPTPDVVLPAFAVVLELQGDDPDFATRLQAAFQSFVGLVNLGAAQTEAPPLMLGSEVVDGVAISTANFLPPKSAPSDEPVHIRHNLSPSAVQLESHFIFSSSTGLARDLIQAIKTPATPTESTLLVEAEGAELGKLVEQNRETLITQNVLEKGNDREQAAGEVDLLRKLAEYLGKATLTADDTDAGVRFRLNFQLAR